MRLAPVFLAFALFAGTAVAAPPPQQKHLDLLFSQLAQAQDEEDARDIEKQIDAAFLMSGSASVDLLMSRAEAALGVQKADVARKLIEAVTKLKPDFAEGWHRLAALQAQAKDDRGAMISLQKTVLLNPRQFNACAELAGYLQDYGDKAGALKLYRQALAADPKLDEAQKAVKALSRDVEGEGI